MNKTTVEQLHSILDDFKWTFDNMGTTHTPDHFNRPANAITQLEQLIELTSLEVKEPSKSADALTIALEKYPDVPWDEIHEFDVTPSMKRAFFVEGYEYAQSTSKTTVGNISEEEIEEIVNNLSQVNPHSSIEHQKSYVSGIEIGLRKGLSLQQGREIEFGSWLMDEGWVREAIQDDNSWFNLNDRVERKYKSIQQVYEIFAKDEDKTCIQCGIVPAKQGGCINRGHLYTTLDKDKIKIF